MMYSDSLRCTFLLKDRRERESLIQVVPLHFKYLGLLPDCFGKVGQPRVRGGGRLGFRCLVDICCTYISRVYVH